LATGSAEPEGTRLGTMGRKGWDLWRGEYRRVREEENHINIERAMKKRTFKKLIPKNRICKGGGVSLGLMERKLQRTNNLVSYSTRRGGGKRGKEIQQARVSVQEKWGMKVNIGRREYRRKLKSQ